MTYVRVRVRSVTIVRIMHLIPIIDLQFLPATAWIDMAVRRNVAAGKNPNHVIT